MNSTATLPIIKTKVMKKVAKKEAYNNEGIGSVTIFLAVLTAAFVMYNIWQAFF
jgi:hypothetical protein